MIEKASLTSAIDGFALGAIAAAPERAPIGGVVVAQEIFGLTGHIAEMCSAFAAAGYAAIAPSLYDRVEPGFLAALDAEGIERGRQAAAATGWDQVASDIQAAIDALPKPCYVAGFCWGGAAAWTAASRCAGLKAAACFYGRLIVDLLQMKPTAPAMLHYGARDASIPPEHVERVREAAPDSPIYLYDAGHGFCRAGSRDFDAASRDLAMARTLDWFARWR